MSKQEVFDMCLKMYGQAALDYARTKTDTSCAGDNYLSMCNWQNQLWDAAQDLVDE